MKILSSAVYSSVTMHGLGLFKYDKISFAAKTALKAVDKRHRRKFKRQGIVPVLVLEAFWYLGFLPGTEAPQQGMRIQTLLDYLKQGNFQNQISLDKGRWLFESIIKDEFVGPVHRPYRKNDFENPVY